MNMKKCAGPCGITLPVTSDYFHKHGTTNKGVARYMPYCKECRNKALREKGPTKSRAAYMREYRKKYGKENRRKYMKDPMNRMKANLRTLLTNTLNGHNPPGSKRAKSTQILGVSWDEATAHLGPYEPGTHIDHIIPISWARDVEEAEALSCIWNLRRISAAENRTKRDYAPSREDLHPNLPQLALDVYERETASF